MGIITVALAANATRSQKIVVPFECDASAEVGDWVYFDSVTDSKVIVAASNASVRPVVGVIERKRNSTTADVLFLGTFENVTLSLVKGDTVYLDSNGVASTVAPTTGIFQIVGVAVSATELFVKPELRRVRRA